MALTAVSILPWPEIMTTGTPLCCFCDLLQHLEPVEPRALQPNIEEHEMRPPRRDRGERFVGVLRGASSVTFVAQNSRDQISECLASSSTMRISLAITPRLFHLMLAPACAEAGGSSPQFRDIPPEGRYSRRRRPVPTARPAVRAGRHDPR